MERIASGQIRLVENYSFSGLLKLAIEDRVDGAYMNPAVARYQMEQVLGKPGALVFDPVLPHLSDAYRFSSMTRSDLIERFDQFLIDEADLVRSIKERYKVIF